MANEIDKQLEEAAKTLKPAFKQVIDTLAESNKEFAVTAANFRNSTRDSFAGALTANKLKNTLEEVSEGLKEGEGEIAGIDFGEFKKVNDKINALEEQRAERLETANKKGNVLYKARVAFEKAEAAELEAATRGKQVTGAALEKLRTAREEAEKNLAEKTAQQTKSYDENIEREKENRKEYQDQLDKALEEMQKESMEYMENMSGAFKKLTGIDLMGAFDSMVENVNAIGTLFTKGKNTDVFGDIVGGIQNMGENISNGLAKAREGAKVMATNLMASGKQFLKQGKKFAISAGLMIKGLLSSAAAMVATGVSMLAAALGLSVPALLIGLVALALVAGAIYLYNESEGFRTAIDTVVDYIQNIISIIGDIFNGFYEFFAGLFTGDFDRMFGGLKDVLGGLWDLVMAPFKAIGDFFKNVFGFDIKAWLKKKAESFGLGWLIDGEEPNEKVEAITNGADPAKANDMKYADEDIKQESKDYMATINAMSDEERGARFDEQIARREESLKKAEAKLEELRAGGDYHGKEDDIFNAEKNVLHRQKQVDQRTADKQNFFDPEKREYDKLYARFDAGENLSDEEHDRMNEIFKTKIGRNKQVATAESVAAEQGRAGLYDFGGIDRRTGEGEMNDADLARQNYLNRTGGTAGDVADATQGVRDGERQTSQQAIVTTINAPTTNASNTNVKSVNPTPRDTDPTGSRLAAVPA